MQMSSFQMRNDFLTNFIKIRRNDIQILILYENLVNIFKNKV